MPEQESQGARRREYGLEMEPWYRFVHGVIGGIIRLLARLEVEGLEHLPDQGPVMVAVNHLHWLDAPVIFAALPVRSEVWAAEKWENRFFIGALFRSLDAIFIHRGEVDRKALGEAIRRLKAGALLGLAPEGTRSKTGGLPGLSRGRARGALRMLRAREGLWEPPAGPPRAGAGRLRGLGPRARGGGQGTPRRSASVYRGDHAAHGGHAAARIPRCVRGATGAAARPTDRPARNGPKTIHARKPMRRQGCTPGCAVTVLGALISCFLLPYLASSIYAIARIALDVSGTPEWLWGEWVGGWVGGNQTLYMLLTEGPICCAGILGLMAVIMGVVLATSEVEPPAEAEDVAAHRDLPWEDDYSWEDDYLDEELPWDDEDDEDLDDLEPLDEDDWDD
jgi:hypothetical protein